MRIDLVLASGPVAERVQAAWVDRQARKGSGPSDHAPVIVDLDEAPDGDIGPVVPPPSPPGQARHQEEAAAAVCGLGPVSVESRPGRAAGAQSRGRSRSREGCTRLGSPGILG